MHSQEPIKLILVGDTHVGKTSILSHYVKGVISKDEAPTIGAAFEVKEITVNGQSYNMNIWDTAGQEAYRALLPMFFRGASIALVVFDVTNVQSFLSIDSRINEVKKYVDSKTLFAIVGNKIDLDGRAVSSEAISKKANEMKLRYFETSALSGLGINNLFESVLVQYINENTRRVVKSVLNVDLTKSSDDKKCC